MKRKKAMRAAMWIVIALLATGYALLYFMDYDARPPKLPTKSQKNSLTITSNGCCFWVENVTVYVESENGRETLAHHDTLYGYDIYKADLPDVAPGPTRLVVEFRCFYGEESDFSMTVLESESMEDMKKTGVLLYFQEKDDVYLNVIAGGVHTSYKMGSAEHQWMKMDEPNKVYP